jgi:hypothetical protein
MMRRSLSFLGHSRLGRSRLGHSRLGRSRLGHSRLGHSRLGRSRLRLLLISALVLVALPACHRRRDLPADTSAAPVVSKAPMITEYMPDTLRGVVIVEGSATDLTIAVRTASGRVELVGPPRELTMASGLDVVLKGSWREKGRFAALDFLVRVANGREAVDGTLRQAQGQFELHAEAGRVVTLRNVPPAFAGLVGHRLWVVLNSEGGLSEYGVLDR